MIEIEQREWMENSIHSHKYVVKVFNWSEFHLSEMTLLQNPYFSGNFVMRRICVKMNNQLQKLYGPISGPFHVL